MDLLNLLKQPLITAVITITLGWGTIWIRSKVSSAEKKETELWKSKREALQDMLYLHSQVAIRTHVEDDKWLDNFAKSAGQMVVWASDDVLAEYIEYYKERVGTVSIKDIQNCEIHFGKAILAYRKELGYKNRWGKINPRDIALIVRAGGKNLL